MKPVKPLDDGQAPIFFCAGLGVEKIFRAGNGRQPFHFFSAAGVDENAFRFVPSPQTIGQAGMAWWPFHQSDRPDRTGPTKVRRDRKTFQAVAWQATPIFFVQ